MLGGGAISREGSVELMDRREMDAAGWRAERERSVRGRREKEDIVGGKV